ALVTFGALASQPPTAEMIIRGTTAKSFDDVVLELEFAITERNFRITGRNTIGKGLRDRGYEDFPNVEVIHFCNLEYAREVLLLDPGYVAMMPCRITVHEANGKTVVSVILLPEIHPNPQVVAFAKRMNEHLREILAYVMETQSS
ncbi:MAG: DUF302 domain-containing protein, partial [Gammaproteobacteria bacterium]